MEALNLPPSLAAAIADYHPLDKPNKRGEDCFIHEFMLDSVVLYWLAQICGSNSRAKLSFGGFLRIKSSYKLPPSAGTIAFLFGIAFNCAGEPAND